MSVHPLLRPITDADVPLVLELNERHVDVLAPLDAARLAQVCAWAHRAQVIQTDGQFAGFVVTMEAGSAYDSPNYRWFSQTYGEAFHYLDRIVLVEAHRRRGLASAVYDTIEADALTAGRLTLEVNAEPPNAASLAFHARRGYTEVGRLGSMGKRVAMLTKDLTPAVAPSGDSPA